MVGSTAAIVDPDGPSVMETWPLLPSYLKSPVPATNKAGYGFATDVGTSPPSLAAAQVHAGHLADSGDPRGWDRDGAITPLKRWAAMFSGWGMSGLDGTAWYHPMRLTLDSGAVGNGIANPAQDVLNVHSTHGDDLPADLRIYAFGAALGGERVPAAAEALAQQSGIPESNLHPRQPREHLRPQRPELRLPGSEPLHQEADPVPARDQAALSRGLSCRSRARAGRASAARARAVRRCGRPRRAGCG
ncbi:MAG: hypothetical protein U0R51_05940 [Solirubrobacterales bacterium]